MTQKITVQRCIGIDMLRMLSMFMVVVLHVLGPGGMLANLSVWSQSYEAAWLLECAAYCAVNCFALITGYVSVEGRHLYSKLMALWLQVVFYTIGIMAIFSIFLHTPISVSHVLAAFFPVSTKQYWYFTAYFGLFFFIPVLNHIVHTLPAAAFRTMLFSIVFICSFLPTVAGKDLFQVNEGYSMLWLMCLYLIGAYLKIYGIGVHRKRWYLLGYGLCVAGAWLSKLILQHLDFYLTGAIADGNRFISYSSPLILFAAIFLLLLFSRLEIKWERCRTMIRQLGKASFGVYLIHVNCYVWQIWIANRYIRLCDLPAYLMLPFVILIAMLIFAVCIFTDVLRLFLFNKLNIFVLTERVEDVTKQKIEYFSEKIRNHQSR